jgi:hypothetical protein
VKHFKDRKKNMADLSHSSPQGTITMECNKQKDYVLMEDEKVMARKIIMQLGIGHSAMQEMIKTLGYQNYCCWVP